jgi:frataxin-like iron-binding protein CyaY
MMDEQEFKTRSDEALTSLHRALASAADDYGFDVDFNAGLIIH